MKKKELGLHSTHEPDVPANTLTRTAELRLRHFEQVLKDKSCFTYRPNAFSSRSTLQPGIN